PPRRAPPSLARVARARHRNTRRTPVSRRTTPADEPPRATPGDHSGAGLKGAAAERDALRS
ncbi:MAG: hypothetical protein ABEH81_12275, partial [Halopenitus sp.]